MTTHEHFEKLLSNRSFRLEITDRECEHMGTPIRYIWYIQECVCCLDVFWVKSHNKSKYLGWYKYESCAECYDGCLDGLGCGGHYNNFRSFEIKDGNEVDNTDIWDFRQVDPDPDELTYEDE